METDVGPRSIGETEAGHVEDLQQIQALYCSTFFYFSNLPKCSFYDLRYDSSCFCYPEKELSGPLKIAAYWLGTWFLETKKLESET